MYQHNEGSSVVLWKSIAVTSGMNLFDFEVD